MSQEKSKARFERVQAFDNWMRNKVKNIYYPDTKSMNTAYEKIE